MVLRRPREQSLQPELKLVSVRATRPLSSSRRESRLVLIEVLEFGTDKKTVSYDKVGDCHAGNTARLCTLSRLLHACQEVLLCPTTRLPARDRESYHCLRNAYSCDPRASCGEDTAAACGSPSPFSGRLAFAAGARSSTAARTQATKVEFLAYMVVSIDLQKARVVFCFESAFDSKLFETRFARVLVTWAPSPFLGGSKSAFCSGRWSLPSQLSGRGRRYATVSPFLRAMVEVQTVVRQAMFTWSD